MDYEEFLRRYNEEEDEEIRSRMMDKFLDAVSDDTKEIQEYHTINSNDDPVDHLLLDTSMRAKCRQDLDGAQAFVMVARQKEIDDNGKESNYWMTYAVNVSPHDLLDLTVCFRQVIGDILRMAKDDKDEN